MIIKRDEVLRLMRDGKRPFRVGAASVTFGRNGGLVDTNLIYFMKNDGLITFNKANGCFELTEKGASNA